MNHLAALHGSFHEELKEVKNKLYTTFTVVTRLKTIGDESHMLMLCDGYRSMVPNYISYNDQIIFKLTTSHIKGPITTEDVKKVMSSAATTTECKTLLGKLDLVCIKDTDKEYVHKRNGISLQLKNSILRISAFDEDTRCEVDAVTASFVLELMPEQVSKMISSIEQHHRPSDEKCVTVVATYVKQEDSIFSLFKFLAGQLDEDECPCITKKTSAVRTVHLLNDSLHNAIVEHCDMNLFQKLPVAVATKWRKESPSFAVSSSMPSLLENGMYEIKGIDPSERINSLDQRIFRYAHTKYPKFNFDIREPASPTQTTINLGEGAGASSFSDVGSSTKVGPLCMLCYVTINTKIPYTPKLRRFFAICHNQCSLGSALFSTNLTIRFVFEKPLNCNKMCSSLRLKKTLQEY